MLGTMNPRCPALICIAVSFASLVKAAPVVYANSSSQLLTLDVATGAFNPIGFTPANFGLATAPDGTLFGGSLSNLYRIDPTNATSTLVGPFGDFIGSLAFRSDGVLFGTNSSLGKPLFTINTATGAATPIGVIGPSIVPRALGFDDTGNLYATDLNGNLLRVNQTTGAGTIIGNTGFQNVTALVFGNGVMYGFSATGMTTFGSEEIFSINLATGVGTSTSKPDVRIDSAALVLVPEPATFLLLGSALAVIILRYKAKW